MLKWFRLSQRCTAVVVLASLASLGISLAGPHDDECHDAECFAAIAHDSSDHQIAADPSRDEAPPLHCVVCHFARSFRLHSETVFVAAPAAVAGLWINVEIYTAAPVAPAAQPPLRSPPASPVLS